MLNAIGILLFVFEFVFIGGILVGRYLIPVKVVEEVETKAHLLMSDAQFNEFMAEQKAVNKINKDIQETAIKDQVKELNDYLTGGGVSYENFNG